MRQLVLTLLFIAALLGLAYFAGPLGGVTERIEASAGGAQPVPGGTFEQVPLPNDAAPLRLRLSSGLGDIRGTPGVVPTAALPRASVPAARLPVHTAPGFGWSTLAVLALAGLAGIVLARWWSPAPHAQSPALPRVEPDVERPDDPESRTDDSAVEPHEHSADLDALRRELAATQDDLQSARTERDELLTQVGALDQTLAESQQQQATLTETLSQRDHEVLTLRTRLDDITRHDDEATSTVTNLSARLNALDDEGVEQRVINVQFEKALIEARDQLADLSAQLDAERERVEQLNDTLATGEQNTLAVHEARDAQNVQIETLGAEIDTLSQQLSGARSDLAERDAALASLSDVNDRLNSWQSTVDTYRRELRERDARIDEFASTIAERDETIATLGERADEADGLREKLREQEAVARILKDAADSMRLHKARSDERAVAIASLKGALERERQHEARLRSQLADLRKQHDASQTALSDANSDLFDVRQDAEALRRRAGKLESELTEARREAAHWHESHGELSDAVTALRTHLAADLESLVALGDTIHTTLDAPPPDLPELVDVDTASAHADLAALFDAMRAEHAQAAARADSLDGELAETLACLGAMESDAVRLGGELRDARHDRDDTAAVCRALESRTLALTQRIDVQASALADADADSGRLADLDLRLAQLLSEEARLTERVETLAAQRNDAVHQRSEWRAARDAAHAAVQRQRVQRVSMAHERDRLIEELKTLRAGAQAQAQQLVEQRDALAEARASRDAKDAELDSANRTLATLTDELANARHTHGELSEQLSLLRQARDTSEQALEAARRAVDESASASAEAQETLNAREVRLNELAGALNQRQDAISSLEKQVAALTARIKQQGEVAEARVDSLAATNLALRDAMKQVRQDADSDIQRLRSAAESAENTARAVTERLEATRVALDEKQAAVAELKAALAEKTRRLEAAEAQVKATPTTRVVDTPVKVPVLTSRVAAPPVLTRTVSDNDDDPEQNR